MSKIKRKVIKIDEEKCTGCGLCVPDCPEGALQIIDGKARLISDLFCDGLGACIGSCPEGAITIEEREAEPYDEAKVMKNIVKAGKNTIEAHLKHLRSHGEEDILKQALDYLKDKGIDFPAGDYEERKENKHEHFACPGSAEMSWGNAAVKKEVLPAGKAGIKSELRNWPVQIMLANPQAAYFRGADILVSADCVPFAFGNFHQEFVKDKIVLVGCPKLDDIEFYAEKLAQLFKEASPKSVTAAYMEVPCCWGLVKGVQEGIKKSGKKIPFYAVKIGIKGEEL